MFRKRIMATKTGTTAMRKNLWAQVQNVFRALGLKLNEPRRLWKPIFDNYDKQGGAVFLKTFQRKCATVKQLAEGSRNCSMARKHVRTSFCCCEYL